MRRILICDSSKDILDLCEAILADGFRVTTTMELADLPKLIQKTEPDLIIVDHWLCKFLYNFCLRELRLVAGKIPILLFSTELNPRQATIDLKMDGYISKPFDLNTFYKSIELALVKSLL